ncbi:MAG: phosphatidylcholine synthase [Methyloceanibacter sp.]|nr:phosphatidylcholine synthase [Methyloceanibacter sp.]
MTENQAKTSISRLRAFSVHVLTAIGAVLALFALRAAREGDWQTMFVWLGIALFVDAIDGPLARLYYVKTVLPRFSGERLDLIVDYLTYVAIPAFVLTETDMLPESTRVPAAIAVLLSGLFHMSDLHSKTKEGFFVGFPAVWNIVLLYLFVLGLPPYGALAVVAFLVVLTFVPILYVHPFRVVRLRVLTGLVVVAWAIVAGIAIVNPFPSALWIKITLLAAAAYCTAVGLWSWVRRLL